jgi:hypothetical protein
MNWYSVVLTIHLLALLAATAASALVHLAEHRRATAATLREAMEWGRYAGLTARAFPAAIVALVLSGVYMVNAHWSWHTGWILAGLAGALAMPVGGAIIRKRGMADARRAVARLQSSAGDLPNDQPGDLVAMAVGNANAWLAVAIVLVMTLKPGLAASIALLVLGAAAGALRGARHASAAQAAASVRAGAPAA